MLNVRFPLVKPGNPGTSLKMGHPENTNHLVHTACRAVCRVQSRLHRHAFIPLSTRACYACQHLSYLPALGQSPTLWRLSIGHSLHVGRWGGLPRQGWQP